MGGRTIAIVHAGEDIPTDPGYVPLRYGRLARLLTQRGDEVIRITPTFSHFRRTQRPPGVVESDEGTHVLVPTVGYDSNYAPQRARYFVQLAAGSIRTLRPRRRSLDAVLLGVPPPGIVTAHRLALGSTPLLADVRDLWPEAFAVGRRAGLMPVAKAGGRILSQDLRSADAITAVSEPMLAWAPDIPKRRHVVPIGLLPRPLDPATVPDPSLPLQVCFLSNHSHGFDFQPVFTAWKRHRSQMTGAERDRARFAFIGCEPSTPAERELIDDEPTVEFLGRVAPDELTAILGGFDVGVAPSSPEWEHSVGNKIFDYLSAGLFVLHSIDPATARPLDRALLGRRLDRTAADWERALQELHDRRAELRTERPARIERADQLFGPDATAGALAALIDEIA